MIGRHARAVAVLGVLLLSLSLAGTVQASPLLQQSTPGANQQTNESPEEIRIRFTEPVDVSASAILVLDRFGGEVASGVLGADEQARELTLPLDTPLPPDVYTVQWRAVPAGDGEQTNGLFPFTIGSPQQMLAGLPPETDFSSGASWLEYAGRMMIALGTLLSSGLLITWLLFARPIRASQSGLRRIPEFGWLRAVVFGSLAFVVLGFLIREGAAGDVTGRMLNADGEPGWLLFSGHMLAVIVVALIPGIWRVRSGWRLPVLGSIAAGAFLLPLSLGSQLGNEMVGRSVAVAVQWVHLLIIGLLAGGIVVAALLPRSSALFEDSRSRAISWLHTVLLAAIPVWLLTTLYAGHLTVGNLVGLIETGYGQTFVLYALAGFVLAAVVLLRVVVLGRGVTSGGRESLFWLAPGVAIALLLVLSGTGVMLDRQESARDFLVAEDDRHAVQLDGSDLDAMLYLAPGVAGFNRVTLDVARQPEPIPDTAQALARLTPVAGVAGAREIVLTPQQICTADGEVIESTVARFDASTSDFSLAGRWNVELTVWEPAREPARFTLETIIHDEPPALRAPDPPLRFSGIQATMAVVTLALVVGLSILMLRYQSSFGRNSVLRLFTVVLLVFTVLSLWQGRITHTPEAQARNPIPRTVESIEIGREVYLEHCAVCHGDDGTGTGDAAEGLDRRPSDLTAAHMDTHPVGDVAWWIREGIDPAMPGFGDQLSDEDVWHLVNYLRSLRHALTDG